ncbi:PP2C family protein-serine/threonine phosphatase [Sphingomonas solaris]|uniref:Serine/threonine-protein phosphatase n=1 Tax=Alterirhizorhabdus solaris TaxID=2529389 RepID=A0A558QX53_9SPHN|nr:protein phosphatase 2C domain-containing protein [Sphingomonas solaris]TVV71705.1 serine/threonine-protein phosphatase [Sphingomonas solaris]
MEPARSVRSSHPRFTSTALSHPGCRRTVNEDRLLDRAGAGLWAIADGMGGHRAGDVAAARTIASLEEVERGDSGFVFLSDALARIEAANAALYGAGQAGGTGSTLVALLVHGGHYACLWAGDSRAYLYRAGRLLAVTRDHSLVQQLVDQGALTEEERHRHPQAHVITRAVGARPNVEIDRRFAPIMAGDIFLLCSDGLTACLADDEIAGVLATHSPPEAAQVLLATALARCAQDNVSLIVVAAA